MLSKASSSHFYSFFFFWIIMLMFIILQPVTSARKLVDEPNKSRVERTRLPMEHSVTAGRGGYNRGAHSVTAGRGGYNRGGPPSTPP
uniref:Putative cold-inducible protein n=1 Tax=Camellia sinensis TaxID=4442 RepID=B2CZY5_CAMSI|nr:putative cold-inducible protein [Camellia sinensis]ACV89761.1 putative cold-inducible protein [Camellia sinensis]